MADITIAGLILAGGQGSRVNEADKGLLPWRGKPLVAHVAQRLAPQVGRLIISANRNAEAYAVFGQVVGDDARLGAWQGPLAGLAAGLAACTEEWLVCVPCDTPLIPQDLAARLTQAALSSRAPLAVASCQGRRHAVCMALRPTLLDDLRAYLAAGDRKVAWWQDRAGAVEVSFDDVPQAFLNLNTAEDFAFAQG
ncbi:molybdenum cofactor guanylyltransferase MobA [Bordetella hinzii]|uniref:Molybdenum cofactor guanylyltransferase n=1 Tax=Bordetella hinzii TaxID=103855 RepID=A0AAN1RTV0_9BORD|nr:molybdenum cofactor guanylyltransferase MobA [Bordetella hinzii]AKQ54656.1 Molybdenum cofactor guanylyltransferase [Bordetella hinzii]AKQ59169.1 Molybdenum cofactor guanylyltransferase [Bordetella hinzii]AZW15570.1 molybdenum cofactor guanylyltransferase [Bordetella hinzii]KCB33174.1 molybdenum cofactor guanylyltransferase [Bordetella hinzii L60]KCB41739.1 molybdenum cofactor guanylyltransferase [Bordetella hinzii 4161]